jgi:hypothetical protein
VTARYLHPDTAALAEAGSALAAWWGQRGDNSSAPEVVLSRTEAAGNEP